MKILHILNSNKYSGAENVVITIINQMKQNNDIVYVSPDGPIKEYLENNNINYEPVEKISIKEIKRVIKKYNPDIIHAHDFTASVISSIASKKIKVISHIHCNPTWIKKINLHSILYLISTIKYSKILLVSKSIIKEYVFGKFIRDKVEIVGNPIDIEKIVLKSNEYKIEKKYDLIFIGRLVEEKKPFEFIKIVAALEKKMDIQAAIIGDGVLKEKCKEMIVKNNLEKSIELKGFLKNPYPILKNSKILCVNSKYEGYGMVAVEAIILGKPVVANNVGGIPNIINDKCGKITNNKEEMIEEIIKLLTDIKYYEIKHIEALKRADELDNVDDYIKRLNEIYLTT